VPRLSRPQQHYVDLAFDDELPTDEGWAKYNRHYWCRDYPGFARFFFEQMATEPHSTKLIDDATGWAIDGSADAMIAENGAAFTLDLEAIEEICRRVTCPMLIVHGTDDRCQPIARAHRLAELTGAPLVVVDGANHLIPGRHPVLANLLIRDFVRSLEGGIDR
jgi:pimeloyl-ACP methyl ester carboxylesterase